MIKINKISSCIAASALITAASSCGRKPLVEMPKDMVPSRLERTVDSLSKKSADILNDSSYKFYGRDTLLLSPETYKTMGQFENYLNKKAESNDESVIIGSYTAFIPVYNGKTTTLIPQVQHQYDNEHINHKAIVREGKIFTKDSTDMYLPVEYYGQINPKILSKDR